METKKVLAFSVIFLLALVFLYTAYLGVNRGEEKAGGSALDCELRSIEDGSVFNLSELKGKRFVLQVFATWCGYCAKEHPVIMEVSEHVPVYGILMRDTPQRAKDWLSVKGNPYTFIGVDESNKCLVNLNVKGVPQTSVVDENGKILFRGDSTTTKANILHFFE